MSPGKFTHHEGLHRSSSFPRFHPPYAASPRSSSARTCLRDSLDFSWAPVKDGHAAGGSLCICLVRVDGVGLHAKIERGCLLVWRAVGLEKRCGRVR